MDSGLGIFELRPLYVLYELCTVHTYTYSTIINFIYVTQNLSIGLPETNTYMI